MRPNGSSASRTSSSEPAPRGGPARDATRRRAVVTIASANYLARVRVLFRSLAIHEPAVRRFLLVVDRPLTALGGDEPFEAIWAEELGIPDFDDFIAQYDVTEANTAVKPYVLAHLFEQHDVDELVYLDPDIEIMAPLEEVWSALARGNVVLTPHLRDPYRDHQRPTELGILQAGTYNLGFVGLRRGPHADRLLEWWAEKTRTDCVIDFANGLFVDQKWMDLVPGYVDDVVVLRDPGYNVAYWNLHERELTEENGRVSAGGRPVAFFHFSGYDPKRPWDLSRHQTRHQLRSMPVLRGLCDAYAARLAAEGQHDEGRRPYGFDVLGNGIPLSPGLRWVARQLRIAGLPFPHASFASAKDADAFCEFAMTPNASFSGSEIAPFARYVLTTRPDVHAAYPRATVDPRDPGFRQWLANCAEEIRGRELVDRFGAALDRVNPFDRIHRLYQGRDDLRAAFPDAFRTLDGLSPFVSWLYAHGLSEAPLTRADVDEFVQAGRVALSKVVELYVSKPELHPVYPLALLPCGTDFPERLLQDATREGSLTVTEIRWFEERRRNVDPGELAFLTALRNQWVRQRFPLGATRFGWEALCTWMRAESARRGFVLPELPSAPPHPLALAQQLEVLAATGTLPTAGEGPFRSPVRLRELAEVAAATVSPLAPLRPSERAQLDSPPGGVPRRGVNLAGYFHYVAGVGSSVRSMALTLDAAGIPHEDVTLPVCPSAGGARDRDYGSLERFRQVHRPEFEVGITVANADAMRVARAYLGPAYEHRRRHIGYWVWETDQLPGNFAPAAEGLESIWTPSEFSALAIRRTVGPGVPVHVVPHAVAVREPFDPRPLPVALPEKRTLIGFFFDARSVPHRKNPEGLLRAFRMAFRSDDKVSLVLKVSHAADAPEEMRKLVALSEGLPVVWVRDVKLDDLQTTTLVSRLDVYASLHRAEGFGLVLAEAMALGKTVVATGHSGNLDFMDDDCARLIRHREVTTDRAHGPYPRGIRWAEPDLEHAAEVLRAVAASRGLRDEIGKKARARVERTLAPRAVARTVRALLGFGGDAAVDVGRS